MSSQKALKRANFGGIGMSTISKRSNKIKSQNLKEEGKKPYNSLIFNEVLFI